MSSGWIVLGVIVILVLFAIGAYNRLVALRQRVDQSFADIDVQLKQRHDLIPNLVETVKGYASHERGTLDDVVKARNSALSREARKKSFSAWLGSSSWLRSTASSMRATESSCTSAIQRSALAASLTMPASTAASRPCE